MGWFSQDTEADALKQIEKINVEMRAISALIHLNYNMIDGRNRNKVISHYNNIISHGRKYDRIKANLSEMDRMMLMGATVDVWNGATYKRHKLLTNGIFQFNVIYQQN